VGRDIVSYSLSTDAKLMVKEKRSQITQLLLELMLMLKILTYALHIPSAQIYVKPTYLMKQNLLSVTFRDTVAATDRIYIFNEESVCEREASVI
jgi:hypothetical protein